MRIATLLLAIAVVWVPAGSAAADQDKKPVAKKASAAKTKSSAKSAPRKAVAKAAPKAAVKRTPVKAAAAGGTGAGLASAQHPAAEPEVRSSAALVMDAEDGRIVYAKNVDKVQSIASITKLMTAMVVIDAELPLEEIVRIEKSDIDLLKGTGSRLVVGADLTRRELLHLALMSSENRAAHALGRTYPGGIDAFVAEMNRKAAELGMAHSHFVEPTGLSSDNVSTAHDLSRLVIASLDYPLIREFSTSPGGEFAMARTGRRLGGFGNSNGLVRNPAWHIDVSKTGYISEAGRCLVMHARIAERPVVIVLLDSWGKYTRIGDANRIKKWMETRSLAVGSAS